MRESSHSLKRMDTRLRGYDKFTSLDKAMKILQNFRFSSFPRMRESSHSLKRMDTRLRGYDEFTSLDKALY